MQGAYRTTFVDKKVKKRAEGAACSFVREPAGNIHRGEEAGTRRAARAAGKALRACRCLRRLTRQGAPPEGVGVRAAGGCRPRFPERLPSPAEPANGKTLL
jgi:hypothetical protein